MNKPLSPEVLVILELNKHLESTVLNTMIKVVNDSLKVDFAPGQIVVEGYIDFGKMSVYHRASEELKRVLIALFKDEGYLVDAKLAYHLIISIKFRKIFQTLSECTLNQIP